METLALKASHRSPYCGIPTKTASATQNVPHDPLMLTQTEHGRSKKPLLLAHEPPPLLHQLQPRLPRLLLADRRAAAPPPPRSIIIARRPIRRSVSFRPLRPPPPAPLRRHVRRRDDPDVRIDQEQREELPVPRSRPVREREGLDPVLQDVREGEQTALRAGDAADGLEARAVLVAAEDGGQPGGVVLGVGDGRADRVGGGGLAE